MKAFSIREPSDGVTGSIAPTFDTPAPAPTPAPQPTEADVTRALTLTDCRPEVLAFAILMERELRANAAKGHWRAGDPIMLAQRSVQEAKELVGAVAALDQTANMAMMTADVCGALPDFTPPFDLEKHLHRQRRFSERTFGPGARTNGVIDHIRKELRLFGIRG